MFGDKPLQRQMNFTDKNADALYGLLSDQKSWNGRALLTGCVVPGAGSRWRVATHEVKTCGTMLRRESAPTDEALMPEGKIAGCSSGTRHRQTGHGVRVIASRHGGHSAEEHDRGIIHNRNARDGSLMRAKRCGAVCPCERSGNPKRASTHLWSCKAAREAVAVLCPASSQ